MVKEYEHISRCRSCGADIVFLRTKNNKQMPCDAATVDHEDVSYDPDKHISHFTTCDDPNRFSQKNKGK